MSMLPPHRQKHIDEDAAMRHIADLTTTTFHQTLAEIFLDWL